MPKQQSPLKVRLAYLSSDFTALALVMLSLSPARFDLGAVLNETVLYSSEPYRANVLLSSD